MAASYCCCLLLQQEDGGDEEPDQARWGQLQEQVQKQESQVQVQLQGKLVNRRAMYKTTVSVSDRGVDEQERTAANHTCVGGRGSKVRDGSDSDGGNSDDDKSLIELMEEEFGVEKGRESLMSKAKNPIMENTGTKMILGAGRVAIWVTIKEKCAQLSGTRNRDSEQFPRVEPHMGSTEMASVIGGNKGEQTYDVCVATITETTAKLRLRSAMERVVSRKKGRQASPSELQGLEATAEETKLQRQLRHEGRNSGGATEAHHILEALEERGRRRHVAGRRDRG